MSLEYDFWMQQQREMRLRIQRNCPNACSKVWELPVELPIAAARRRVALTEAALKSAERRSRRSDPRCECDIFQIVTTHIGAPYRCPRWTDGEAETYTTNHRAVRRALGLRREAQMEYWKLLQDDSAPYRWRKPTVNYRNRVADD